MPSRPGWVWAGGPGRAGLALLAVLGLLREGTAGAYVRSRSNACNPIYWPQQCVFVTLDQTGAVHDGSEDLPFADVVTATQSAISAWADLLPAAGSYLQLRYQPADGARETVMDYTPTIKFRYDACASECQARDPSTGWCRPAINGSSVLCYDRSAAALTTVFFYDVPTDRSRDGQIIDADIELNAVANHFYLRGVTARPNDGRTPLDLWNTLTHELGHLQGLEHTCLVSSDESSACTVDQNGDRAPLCRQVMNDPLYNQTTMFASAAADEITKRVPKDDDLAGVAAIYPSAVLSTLGNPRDPYSCVPPQQRDPKQPPFSGSSAGCGVGAKRLPASAGSAAALGLAAVGIGLVARRRRLAIRQR